MRPHLSFRLALRIERRKTGEVKRYSFFYKSLNDCDWLGEPVRQSE